uniref:Ovule protein n=1 Tax=Syphacia muris TaxID=451379 RepID=A0A0N5B005_9BILA
MGKLSKLDVEDDEDRPEVLLNQKAEATKTNRLNANSLLLSNGHLCPFIVDVKLMSYVLNAAIFILY